MIGFGAATRAESFSFEYKHLLIPQKCDIDAIKSEDLETNRFGGTVITSHDALRTLVHDGNAYVYPTDYKDLKLIAELFDLEREARKNMLGCAWQNAPIANADSITKTEQFYIVTGRVLDTYESYENIYLNFGEDWKTDFTVRIQKKNKAFKGYDFESLQGKNIEVRGFVEYYNGPSLTLEHPALIKEIIE
mgnify:CR=1 FL=1